MFLDHGVGVVVVDTFEVFRFDLPPRDAGIGNDLRGTIAHEVLDKNRIGVGALGHRFFIRALQHAIEFAAGRAFDEGNHLGQRQWMFGAQPEGDLHALIVRAAGADRLGAGAQGGDIGHHGGEKVVAFSIGGRGKTSRVVDQAGCAGDGSFFLEKKRKLELEMGTLAVQPADECAQEVLDVLRVQDGTVGLQDLEKAAHVGAFEFLG